MKSAGYKRADTGFTENTGLSSRTRVQFLIDQVSNHYIIVIVTFEVLRYAVLKCSDYGKGRTEKSSGSITERATLQKRGRF